MRIKTKIGILLLVSIVLTLSAGLSIINYSRLLQVSFEKDRNSELITRGVFELNILTNELLNNPLNRSADQWEKRYESLLLTLEKSKALFENQSVYFQEIEQNLGKIKMITLEMSKEISFHGSIGRHDHDSLVLLYQSKISSLLQEIVSISQKLKKISRKELKASHENTEQVLFIFISGFMILILGYSILFFFRILKPVTRLFTGAKAIGKGNFDHKISQLGQDELGQLSQAFNTMSMELKKITVSRNDLEQEIKQRKSVEVALEKAHEELETRVEERTRELFKTNEELTREIHGRIQVEQALKIANKDLSKEHDQRKRLSRNLINLQERDRRKVAMELHDHIGQNLTSLKMNMEMILEKLKPDQGEVGIQINTAQEKTIQIIRDVKNISHGLWPATMDELGMVSSLRELFSEIERLTDLKIYFFCQGIPRELEKQKQLSLYRIAQEALNNIIRHARAEKVFVNLVVKKEQTISLSVEDDGIGFSQERKIKPLKEQKSLGLLIMRERAVQLGGELTIESGQGKGTHLLVEIPA